MCVLLSTKTLTFSELLCWTQWRIQDFPGQPTLHEWIQTGGEGKGLSHVPSWIHHYNIFLIKFPGNYRPQTKLRKGNVFTSVCQEFCPQWGVPPRQTPPPCRHPLADTPPGRHTPTHQTATAAGGTHPTGMHSCIKMPILSQKRLTFLCSCRIPVDKYIRCDSSWRKLHCYAWWRRNKVGEVPRLFWEDPRNTVKQ